MVQYGFAVASSKPALVVPRTIRGGGICKANDGGDLYQISECSEICGVRIPSGATRQLPLCPRGALGAYEFAADFCKKISAYRRAEVGIGPYEAFNDSVVKFELLHALREKFKNRPRLGAPEARAVYSLN